MKSNLKKPHANSFIKALLLGVLFSSLFASCNKDTNSAVDLPTGDATISIDVAGVNDEEEGEKKTSVSKSAMNSIGYGEILSSKEVSYEGLDAVVSTRIDQKRDSRSIVANNRKNNASNSELRAAVMTPGIKYRLLLYLNGTFVKSVAAESGVASHVEVSKDVEYNWYAFSYNSTDDIPDVSNTSAPTVESKVDKPLLYASGTVMVTGEGVVDKPLRVQFAHRTARVGAEISARGAFAGIESVTSSFASSDYIKKGNLNLLTGQYESLSTVDVGNLNFTQFSAATKDTIKVAYYYTAGQGANSAIKVNVQALTLKLDLGDTRVFTNMQFSDNVDLSWGYRRTVFLDLIESPLTVNGIKWARTNLYFSQADRAYRFRHQIHDPYNRSTEEYWNYKAPFPNGTIGAQDPCTLVYPINKWRMPNGDEIDNLIGVKDSRRTLHADYVEYTATGTAAPYPSNKLRINKMGYYNIALGIFGLLSDDKQDGYFWSTDTGFLGGAITGVNGYRVSDNREFLVTGDYVYKHHALSSWGGTENVRCVRNE